MNLEPKLPEYLAPSVLREQLTAPFALGTVDSISTN